MKSRAAKILDSSNRSTHFSNLLYTHYPKRIIENKLALDSLSIVLYSSGVNCGFPGPATDHEERRLSLDKHLVKHPESTFFIRARGTSMMPIIHDGDILVVDRSLEARAGKIVLAILDGGFTAKYLAYQDGNHSRPILRPANPSFNDIVINECNDFAVWGVVTYIIHQA